MKISPSNPPSSVLSCFLRLLFLMAFALSGGVSHAVLDDAGMGSDMPDVSGVERSVEAERGLLDLVLKQRRLFEMIEERPDLLSDAEIEERLLELLDGYRVYNQRFPDDVEALILEAKLLQVVEQREAAFQIYLRVDSLNPDLAVVQQQIGNHLAEDGKGLAALPFLFRAVDLEPDEAVYHYSLGELLHAFADEFIAEGVLEQGELDSAMQRAFRNAFDRQPASFDLFLRYGESFYDVKEPDWPKALAHWEAGDEHFGSVFQEEVISLHQARVLVELERYAAARERLAYIRHSALRTARDKLHERIDKALEN